MKEKGAAYLTPLAMIAFAANSILTRSALGPQAIDAATFSTIRIASGAVTLVILTLATVKPKSPLRPDWPGAFLLFLYAVPFSFAYNSLAVGTGALILFGVVQTTMLVAAIRQGERPGPLQWLGLLLAFGGLVYLVFPGLEAPSLIGSGLMALAGVAWGFYTLRGRGARSAISATASNFLYAVPFVIVVEGVAMSASQTRLSPDGILLALCSGTLASGVGYAIWYGALRGLTATRASIVQLSVPAIAGVGGLIFMSEVLTLRFILASAAIIGGVALALRGGPRRHGKPEQ